MNVTWNDLDELSKRNLKSSLTTILKRRQEMARERGGIALDSASQPSALSFVVEHLQKLGVGKDELPVQRKRAAVARDHKRDRADERRLREILSDAFATDGESPAEMDAEQREQYANYLAITGQSRANRFSGDLLRFTSDVGNGVSLMSKPHVYKAPKPLSRVNRRFV